MVGRQKGKLLLLPSCFGRSGLRPNRKNLLVLVSHMYKNNPLSFCPAAAGACFIIACGVSAQTLSTLHSFNGSGGATPAGSLILMNNTLYGKAWNGGTG